MTGAVAEPTAAPSLEDVLELGRRADGFASLDALAVAEIATAVGAGADLRSRLDAESVTLALPLEPIDGMATFLGDSSPSLLVAGRDDAFVVYDATAGELREVGDALDGRLREARVASLPILAELPVAPAAGALARAHLRHAVYLAGVGKALVTLTRDRAVARRQFDQRVWDFQAVAFLVAKHAARWRPLLAHAEALGEEPPPGASAALLAGAAELALATAADLLPLHGSHGLTAASPAQRLYRHAGVAATRWGVPRRLRERARDLLDDEGELE